MTPASDPAPGSAPVAPSAPVRGRTRLLWWLIANGAFAYLCQYVATHPDDAAWARVLTFIAWSYGVLSFVCGMVLEPEHFTVETAKRWDRPEWFVTLDVLFDLAVVVFFVWLGWGWTAGAYLAHLIGLSALRATAKKRLAKAGAS